MTPAPPPADAPQELVSSQILKVNDLAVDLDGRTVVDLAQLDVCQGEVVGLMGPNGCGKSTVLRTIYRALRPRRGTIFIGELDVLLASHRRSAQVIGALAQQSTSDFDFTVEETVAMGRLPHGNGGRLSPREHQLCWQALSAMGIDHLRERGMLGLSGGERQRVLIARALVQEPELLVLDEPTNHLDLAHQIHLASLLRRLECGVLVVLHDLNLAASVCDRLIFVRDGQVVAEGSPAELLTAERIREVFDVDVHVVRHPFTGAPQVLYELESRSACSSSEGNP